MNYLAQTVRLIWHVLTQREVVLYVGKDIGKDTCMYAKQSGIHGLAIILCYMMYMKYCSRLERS